MHIWVRDDRDNTALHSRALAKTIMMSRLVSLCSRDGPTRTLSRADQEFIERKEVSYPRKLELERYFRLHSFDNDVQRQPVSSLQIATAIFMEVSAFREVCESRYRSFIRCTVADK